jgi:hypothetical protein
MTVSCAFDYFTAPLPSAMVLPIFFLLVIALAAGISYSAGTTAEYPLRAVGDSILALSDDGQITRVEVTRSKPIYVYAVTGKTVSFPLEVVRKVVCDMDQYTFSHIMTRIDFLCLEPAGSRRPVYFVEVGGSFMAAALYLGVFDSSGIDPRSGSAIRFEHYADSALYKKCRSAIKAMIKVEPRDFSLGWRLRSINQTTTRVALISRLSLNMWIPQWLYNLTAKFLYPGVVQDLEKYLIKTYGKKQ